MTKSTKILAAMGVVAGLGAALAIPYAGGHAATTANTEVQAIVGAGLSITATSPISAELPAEVVTTLGSGQFTVSTNNANGYGVTIKGLGDKTDLEADGISQKIAYGAPSTSSNNWQLSVGATPVAALDGSEIASGAVGTHSHDFSVKASARADLPVGTYNGGVTFTAVAK